MTDKLILDHLEKMDRNLYTAIWSPETAGMLVALAQSLAMLFMLVVVARIAFDTIARHKPLDLSQLVKPVLITLVLANWFLVSSAVFHLVRPVETFFKESYAERIDEVDRLRSEREGLVRQFHDRLARVRADQEVTRKVAQSSRIPDEETENEKVKAPWGDSIFSEFFDKVFSMDWLVAEWMVDDAKLSDWLQSVLFWIGEVFWEFNVYFIFLVRYIAMAVLVIFGPVFMAASILPAFEDGWRTWVGRAVSIAFYGSIAYFVMAFMMVIIEYAIRADIGMLAENLATQETFMAYMKFSCGNFIGTSGLYCIALFVGCGALLMVPEAATWVWPSEAFRSSSHFVEGMNQSVKDTVTAVAAMATAGVGAAAGAAAGASGGAAAGRAAGHGAQGMTGEAAAAGGPAGPGPGPVGPDGIGGGSGVSPDFSGEPVAGTGAQTSSSAAAGGYSAGGGTGFHAEPEPVAGRGGYGLSETDRERAAELENLVQLRQKLELYDLAVREGRGQEFVDRFFSRAEVSGTADGTPRIQPRPEIAALEDRFLNARSDSAAREDLIRELDRRIDEFEARFGGPDGVPGTASGDADGDRWVSEQARSLKERMARYEQAEAEGRTFEFQLSELEAALGMTEAGLHKRPQLAALEARYLRSKGNPQARRDLLDSLDELIARYEGGGRSGSGDAEE